MSVQESGYLFWYTDKYPPDKGAKMAGTDGTFSKPLENQNMRFVGVRATGVVTINMKGLRGLGGAVKVWFWQLSEHVRMPISIGSK